MGHPTRDVDADVVIVGAGVFGAAIATALARQGRSVFLLERSLKEPDRIVGELMQPGGVRALEKLGLRHCLDDIDAIPVHGYHIIFNDRPVTIPYPKDDFQATTKQAQTTTGLSFHHGRFVQKLRAAATKEPNVSVVETEVDGLIKTEGSSQVLGVKGLTAGKRDYFFAPLTIVADGYRSKFRAENSSRKPVAKSKFWALELHDVLLPAPCFGHVLIGPFSPVLLYQIGTHDTRALVNVPDGLEAAQAANEGVLQYMRDHVLPQLPPAVQPAFLESLDKGRLRCMPNSFLPAVPSRVPGLIVAGDALNMRHPLTGGGMTVALNDVVLLTELLSPSKIPDLHDASLVLRQAKAFHWRRKRHSLIINVLAQALYILFAADDFYLEALQQGCFEYFKKGGSCVDTPAGLLGGLIQRPLVLVYHFFAVAWLSVWALLLSQPIWKLLITLVQCGGVLLKACWVLFPYIAAELAR
ncbi:putative squalene monooxygenase [Tolypocladium ophioglossoides CBS 100239]|uniref:Squalene monooxygenase n=1 Tax=Tolypocladium ophioglossoides (strain CBS 100239) TaxID=1163406 RepID=A0A0L0MZ25_TOLOC|nr:putative squalene monooxygenase [Tolypocladium ophioglossoides CBS 100239]